MLHSSAFVLTINLAKKVNRKSEGNGPKWRAFCKRTKTINLISLATGTKCIGEIQRSSTGSLLNDSHAEVLARRLLIKYLFSQIASARRAGQSTIFDLVDIRTNFKLRDGIKFHLFITDVPCGDASIFPQRKRKSTGTSADAKHQKTSKHDIGEEEDVLQANRMDLHRTGAKCVPSGTQDLLLSGVEYHVAGVLRTKPGRGNKTTSMSCSDKLMKWCTLGMQGGLLSNLLLEPVFLSSLIISDPHFNLEAMRRALSFRGRSSSSKHLCVHVPEIHHSMRELFIDQKFVKPENSTRGKVTPSGMAILFCPSCSIHEVSVNGRVHGITKKKLDTQKAMTSVCKRQLFTDFKQLVKDTERYDLLTYHQCKRFNVDYETKRKEFFEIFNDWMKKPTILEDFLL